MKKKLNHYSILIISMIMTTIVFACIVPPRDNVNDMWGENYNAPILNNLRIASTGADFIELEKPSLTNEGTPYPEIYAYIGPAAEISASGPEISGFTEGDININTLNGNYTFAGLSANTLYRIYVVAININGYSVKQIDQSTGKTAPVLNNLHISNCDSTSITLERPSFSTAGNPAPTVTAYIGINGTINVTGTIVSDIAVNDYIGSPVDVSTGDHQFTGLSPSTDYRIYVLAKNSIGYSVEYIPKTDTDAVECAISALTINYSAGDSAAHVTQNVTLLPPSGPGPYGTTVTWNSGNAGFISDSGTVTRPDFWTGNVGVTVTATITKNGTHEHKDFPLTVIAPATYDISVCAAGCDYTTIQAAINAASSGNSIGVKAGTYIENITVNKILTLVGQDRDSTIIQASNANAHTCIFSANNINISGFTIRGATGTNYAGGYLSSVTGTVITNSKIMNNYDGIRLYSASSNEINNNIFILNSNIGIVCYSSSQNNTFSNNTISQSICGINTGDQNNSGSIIENNTLFSNTNEGIVLWMNSSNAQIRGNVSYNNGTGIYIGWSSGCIIENNIMRDNTSGFVFDTANNNIVSNNSIYNNSDSGVVLSGLGSGSNQIYNNTIAFNTSGVHFGTAATSNIVRSNLIEQNTTGIVIAPNPSYTNTDNKIYNNNFVLNTTQKSDTSNIVYYFDNGSTDGGNYWSDWTSPDANTDGFVDSPYVVQTGYSQDNYPYVSRLTITTPSIMAEPSKTSPLNNLAFQADTSESDNGWGGGSSKTDLTDGIRTYDGEWARGLAFSYNTWQQITINFGTQVTFSRVIQWYHAGMNNNEAASYTIQYWDGSAWVNIFETTDSHTYLQYAETLSSSWWYYWSTPYENTFSPVVSNKIRILTYPRSGSHTWLYEVEVYGSSE